MFWFNWDPPKFPDRPNFRIVQMCILMVLLFIQFYTKSNFKVNKFIIFGSYFSINSIDQSLDSYDPLLTLYKFTNLMIDCKRI
jgi:hypothetical protein